MSNQEFRSVKRIEQHPRGWVATQRSGSPPTAESTEAIAHNVNVTRTQA